jgi:hypothetical protein
MLIAVFKIEESDTLFLEQVIRRTPAVNRSKCPAIPQQVR